MKSASWIIQISTSISTFMLKCWFDILKNVEIKIVQLDDFILQSLKLKLQMSNQHFENSLSSFWNFNSNIFFTEKYLSKR